MLNFVRRYQGRLFGLALGIVGDPGLAEDVAQEAFIRILRHASVFDVRRGSVSTWALTITRNLAIDSNRARRAVAVSPEDHLFMNMASTDDAPDDVAIHSDESQRMKRALATLPIEQRRAVILATIYGRSAAEVAVEESIPLGTAKSRIRLGLSRLRESTSTREAL
jgi:RNA polymerase sigma-70 factor (ECF subfamily)